MGWGIDFKADIYLSKQDYGKNIVQVEDKIEELENDISTISTKLQMYSIAEPKTIVPITEGTLEPVDWIHNEVKALLDWQRDSIKHVSMLYLYKEYLEKQPEEDGKSE